MYISLHSSSYLNVILLTRWGNPSTVPRYVYRAISTRRHSWLLDMLCDYCRRYPVLNCWRPNPNQFFGSLQPLTRYHHPITGSRSSKSETSHRPVGAIHEVSHQTLGHSCTRDMANSIPASRGTVPTTGRSQR